MFSIIGRQCVVASIAFVALAQLANAASLTLFTDAAAQAPLVITPLDRADKLLVKVVNNTASDPPSGFLTGWQIELHIAPDASAIGSLGFVSAGKPDDYLFDPVGHFGPSISNSGNELFAFDSSFPASGGVQVPMAPGANLLSIAFSPSAHAYGTFGIYARGDPTTSEWSDAAMPVQERRRFANLPQTGGSVRIADVLVTSPADYNRNGAVDAADYVLWRETLGQNGAGLDADGNGNGMIDAGDYDVWRANFGRTVVGLGAASHLVPDDAPGESSGAKYAVPEPAAVTLVLAALVCLLGRWRRII